MARGQSTIEYLLGLAVVVLGLAALLQEAPLQRAIQTFYRTMVVRIARDHLP